MLRMLAFAATLACAHAGAAEIYKEKCALCHDAGATNAPRLGRSEDWGRRAEKGYAGLLRSALQGVPGTAMLPKAGFPELTEAQVGEAVRYMLASVGLPPDLPARAPRSAAARPAPSSDQLVDDLTLSLEVANALRDAKIGGVQIEARSGRVVLKGVLADAKAVARAVDIAKHVPGVSEIEDRLVAAGHD
jgi:cytochrome c5